MGLQGGRGELAALQEGRGWAGGVGLGKARVKESQGRLGLRGGGECIGGRARSQGLSAQRCLILHLKLFSGLGY